MQNCTAGFARLDMTPPLGVRLGGYFTERIADGVLDPLYVNAVAFGEGEKKAVLIVCDLLSIYGNAAHEWPVQIAEKLGLPRPDLVIYLDMPTDYTEKLMRHRETETNTKADIHEKDLSYLATCRQTGRAAAEHYGWTVIRCVENDQMRSIEDIHAEIYGYVKACMEE